MKTKNLFKYAVLAIILIISMISLLACIGGSTTIEINNFSQLKDAFKADNAEVKLTQDINSNEELIITKLFTLDLNGKTLTVKGFKVKTETEGTLTITNGKIIAVNGDIEILAPKATINLDKVTGNVAENAKITLNGSKNTVNLGEVNFIYIGKDVAVPLTIPADTRVVIASSVTKPITLNVVGGDVII